MNIPKYKYDVIYVTCPICNKKTEVEVKYQYEQDSSVDEDFYFKIPNHITTVCQCDGISQLCEKAYKEAEYTNNTLHNKL